MTSNFYVSGAAAMTSDSMEWTTPRDLFDELDAEFRFDLDAASTHENALCERHWTMAEDGLEMPWEGHVWCNPPYGRGIGKWVRKAAESNRGGSPSCSSPRGRTRPGGTTGWFPTPPRSGSFGGGSSSGTRTLPRRSPARSWCTTAGSLGLGG